jgi:hypothetical protein
LLAPALLRSRTRRRSENSTPYYGHYHFAVIHRIPAALSPCAWPGRAPPFLFRFLTPTLRSALRSAPLPAMLLTVAGHHHPSSSLSKSGKRLASTPSSSSSSFSLKLTTNEAGRLTSPCHHLFPHGSPLTTVLHHPLAELATSAASPRHPIPLRPEDHHRQPPSSVSPLPPNRHHSTPLEPSFLPGSTLSGKLPPAGRISPVRHWR